MLKMIKNTKKTHVICQFAIYNEVILRLKLFSLFEKMKTSLSENYKYLKIYNLAIQFKPCH